MALLLSARDKVALAPLLEKVRGGEGGVFLGHLNNLSFGLLDLHIGGI